MKKLIALSAALLAFALPALANQYASKAQTRILHGWTEPDGTRMAAIEISLADGWHTYWRAPGDAGIPPQLSWQASRNLSAVTFSWPRPMVYDQNGMRAIIYKNRLVLPMALSPQNAGKPIRFKATLDIGICKDICVPLQVNLNEIISPDSTNATSDIKQALATVPHKAAENIRCTTSAGTRGIILTVLADVPRLGSPENAAVETGDPLVWATDPKVSRIGRSLKLETEFVHALGGAFALNRSALRLTLIGSREAVDIQGCD
ncbi:protein-disulfide reductase DsbD domain-containing protein [Lentibacter sp. XHP0401]|jgi:DsbC/DsbD-like thiol-disulfide interchange protein|uniref:protein-disulfide reductase DsbD domain-containing protein n=1 Tax=Lentibacter sp. XHP0401 TaxID=2984334 RepID=UPI0021E84837|nr:protein-disulfide reductase DsbD domain-containing protein [Lentibacter sp. XHP0401]MCV2892921.1 protein-disulfide reductase DsbD family protein [Lentibacter sp. XHP0401]